MAKQLLSEQVTSARSMKLVESTNKKPGCLGTISGVCADYKNPTRNGNFYSRKLWENVFNNDLVRESLEDRVLFGELDHPADRLETNLSNACIVMTGYEFDDNEDVVKGSFDILDTPSGRILKSLLDYGCVCGISSRGEGDVETLEGVNHVDEEGYDFVGFDAVALPAVKKAKPTLRESLQRKGLKESLQEQINSATTKMELDLIENVIKTTKMPELDSLLESINIKSSEIEGTNSSSNLAEDLESSTREIQRLEEENKILTRSLINCKARLKKFVSSRLKISESYSQLKAQHDQLIEDNKNLQSKYNAKSRKVESLDKELTRARRHNERLESNSQINRSAISDSQNKVKSLEESLERSQSACQSQIKKVKELERKIESLTKDLSATKDQLTESQSKVKKLNRSLKENKKLADKSLKDYAVQLSESKGIKSERVTTLLKEGMTAKDVDKIVQEEVDSVSRYSKVNRTADPLLESLARNAQINIKGEVPKVNPEEQDSYDFMRQFYQNNS